MWTQNGYHERIEVWKKHLQAGLEEDGAAWDWTSLTTLKDPEKTVQARVVAKSDGVWAASLLCEAVMQLSAARGRAITVKKSLASGTAYKKGALIAEWKGPAVEVLTFERPFLNLASYVGGIATATQRLVKEVASQKLKRPPRVVMTRKTLPGYRDLCAYGVLSGGGGIHRLALSSGVLVKENHIAAAGGIKKAVLRARQAPHGLRVEVEVRNHEELKEAVEAGAEVIMLDNFTPAQVKAALAYLAREQVSVPIEVSGGINEANIRAYALEGVDIISAGGITHSVTSVDLSMLID
ncbi:MAG: carboxylating nicotinate-nucleotide diphosphorylase [Bacteriovoracia bacterium]